MSKTNPNEIDEVIHQRTRLSIMASIAGVDSLDFKELKAQLGLTDGNLSTHITHLEKAGYVRVTKQFKGKKPRTTITITTRGKAALTNYIDTLQAIIDKTK